MGREIQVGPDTGTLAPLKNLFGVVNRSWACLRCVQGGTGKVARWALFDLLRHVLLSYHQC